MKKFAYLLSLFLLGSSCLSEGKYPDPQKFEPNVSAFETRDAKKMPPEGAIVVTGSSSVAMWHKRIHEDLKPLTIIARGFGGSNMNDLLYFSDRVITKYKPRAVVIYEGDNDTSQGLSTEQILEKFNTLASKLTSDNPELRVYIISIKPSIKRAALWADMEKTNAALKSFCDKNKNFTYIDTAAALLKNGPVTEDIFIQDKLHMNDKGYDIWAETIREVLIKNELKYEKK
jgi:lysophospholipase L1-like esterase